MEKCKTGRNVKNFKRHFKCALTVLICMYICCICCIYVNNVNVFCIYIYIQTKYFIFIIFQLSFIIEKYLCHSLFGSLCSPPLLSTTITTPLLACNELVCCRSLQRIFIVTTQVSNGKVAIKDNFYAHIFIYTHIYIYLPSLSSKPLT